MACLGNCGGYSKELVKRAFQVWRLTLQSSIQEAEAGGLLSVQNYIGKGCT